jgi:hypothetical protein
MVDGSNLMPSGAPQVYPETGQLMNVIQIMEEEEDGADSKPVYQEILDTYNQSKKKNE